MNRMTRHQPAVAQRLAAIHWRWVIASGLILPIIAVIIWVALVFSYGGLLAAFSRGAPNSNHIHIFAQQGAWAIPVFVLALTGVAASWAARRRGGPILMQGLLIGVAAALGELVAWKFYHGAPNLWAWVTFALTVGAGYLGALEAQSAVAGRESLYRASGAIATAQSPQAIVAAIGEHQADARVKGVALWQVTSWDAAAVPTALALLAAWVPPGAPPWSLDPHLGGAHRPLLARLRRDSPTAVSLDALAPDERTAWERLGGRDAILIPLIGRDGAWIGLISVASPAARSLGIAIGGYAAIGAQASVVLENLQLVEEGRRLGALAERQRLAREIHDAVKQQVFATGMQIGAALALIDRDPVAAKARLAEADALVRQAQDELADVIHELRPATLDGRGLAATLRDYAVRWSRQCDIAVEVRAHAGCALPLEAEQALFRVAQEALANVAKHSGATAATIDLSCTDVAVTLQITDDGQGFVAVELDGRGYGLSSMGERVAAFGGRVTIESAAGAGTRVTCICPRGDEHTTGMGGVWTRR